MTTIAACVFGAVSAAAVTAHALRTKSSTRGDRRRAALQRKQLEEMVADWRRELWHSVVPFWLTHAVDEKHGFHTCLDRNGDVLDDTRYHWLQGRAVWTCSRLFRRLKADADHTVHGSDDVRRGEAERLLKAAHNGAMFLKFCKEGGGDGGQHGGDDAAGHPIYFSTTRDGWPLHIQRKPYTAVFYVFGCLE